MVPLPTKSYQSSQTQNNLFSVPKLSLDSPFDQPGNNEPVYTISKSNNHSSRSESTISWGTESVPTPQIEKQSVPIRNLPKQTSVDPPWATHLPTSTSHSNNRPTRQNYTTDQDNIETNSNWTNQETDRICMKLEDAWKVGATENQNQTGYSKTNRSTQSHMDTVRKAIDYSLRQTPGLVKPNLQNTNTSIVGNNLKTNFTNRIWFTARLLIFDVAEVTCDPAESRSLNNLEWKNSISSSALRTFTGIAFPEDSTWTLYEDHKAGHNTKTLPFLRRSVYHCTWGPRTGQPYLPEIDFFPGAILFVNYTYDKTVSEQLRHFLKHTHGIIRILITGVDREAKQKALESELLRQELPKDMWYSVMAKLHVARLPLRPRIQIQLFQLQNLWRQDVRQRSSPIEAFLNLYGHFQELMRINRSLIRQSLEDQQNGSQSSQNVVRVIFEESLDWFRLPHLDLDNLDLLWHALENQTGYEGIPHFSDYLALVFGNLPEFRRQLVVKAFLKMDPNQFGHVKLLDVERFYHLPKWASARLGAQFAHSPSKLIEVLEQFIQTPNRVEFIEFEAYYQGLSIGLGECPVDNAITDSDYALLSSIIPSSDMAHQYFTDSKRIGTGRFEKFICDCWGI